MAYSTLLAKSRFFSLFLKYYLGVMDALVVVFGSFLRAFVFGNVRVCVSSKLAQTVGHALVAFCSPASISHPRGLRGCVQALVTLGAGLSANCTEINRAANSLEQVR